MSALWKTSGKRIITWSVWENIKGTGYFTLLHRQKSGQLPLGHQSESNNQPVPLYCPNGLKNPVKDWHAQDKM